jgi:hypothetical protein
MLKAMDPATVNERNGLVRVLKTMQVSTSRTSAEDMASALEKLSVEQTESEESESESTPYPHIFAIGDAADAFGAIPAGHNAYAQVSLVLCRLFVHPPRFGDLGGTRSQEYYQTHQEHCVGI